MFTEKSIRRLLTYSPTPLPAPPREKAASPSTVRSSQTRTSSSSTPSPGSSRWPTQERTPTAPRYVRGGRRHEKWVRRQAALLFTFYFFVFSGTATSVQLFINHAVMSGRRSLAGAPTSTSVNARDEGRTPGAKYPQGDTVGNIP